MTVGVALPQMATGLDAGRLREWCAAIDEGPFSSISAGERITFHNLEGITLCTAAAAMTRRVRVLFNVAVLPWHATALVAKQIASMDVISDGRVEVAVGVGGRKQDYDALGASFAGRHGRLDAAVAELRRLWAGGPADSDGSPIGPAPVQPDGPPIYASAMGPKSLARAAAWADGVSAFTLLGDAAEAARGFEAARSAWSTAGRDSAPRVVTGSFVALGDGARDTLVGFAERYLRVFSPDMARGLAEAMPLHEPDALLDLMRRLAADGCDEFIVVPASSDPAQVELIAEVVRSL
jgi:alkanesulfonate monooxygenase SsuD/methylene tetrahydromethanopterin reductase-like flavin-dependent oxidoreductase (luciferase family)